MTISSTSRKAGPFLGNDTATVFPFTFKVFKKEDVRVTLTGPTGDDTVLTLDSHYSVTLNSNQDANPGGSVTYPFQGFPLPSPLPVGYRLTITGGLQNLQPTDIQNQGGFYPQVVEDMSDRSTIQIQQLQEEVDRSLKFSVSDPGLGAVLPPADLRANKILAFDENGRPTVAIPTSGSAADVMLQLAATYGSSLIGFLQAGVGAVPQTVQQKLRNLDVTVEDFGAVGDGLTDDSAALYAMHNAHGYIRLKRRTYYLGNSFFSIVAEKVCIIGEGKAAFNNATTQAVDGTGTILLGSLLLRADHMYCADFTVDVSRFPTKKEGIVTDARVGQIGVSCVLERLGSIARPDADSSHGLLVEGFARHTITDIDVANHNYGVVSKSRDGFISRIRGRNVKTAVVYPKSSLPAVGGDVADASVNNIEIRDVQGRGGLSDYGCAVWIHAEGVNAVNIRVSGAYYLGGLCAVRVLGTASTPYVVDCSISDVVGAQNATAAVVVSGATFDTRIDGVTADNPVSGLAVSIDASSTNWLLDNVMLVVTDAAITGTSPATLLGSGQWDNFSVRNAFRTMVLATAWGTQRTGKKFGQIALSGEGNLTLSGGASTVAGEVVPNAVTLGDNMIALNGVIGVAGVAAAGPIASAGAGINMGAGKFYICAAVTTSNTYTTFPIYVSANSIQVFSVPSAANIKQIYLDSILVRR